MRQFALDPARIHVVPHGNFDHYVPASRRSRAEARQAIGVDAGDLVLLFFGYIRPYKGLDTLLDAFAEVARREPRARLVIAGRPHTPEEEARYTAAIAAHPAGERIVFHGRFIDSEEVPAYFESADLVALPYRHIYHSGLVHLAYAFGNAVIATRVGDFPETIEDGRTGILVDGTPEALAEGILAALRDPDALQRMGALARHLSATRYGWADIGAQTRAVYAALDS